MHATNCQSNIAVGPQMRLDPYFCFLLPSGDRYVLALGVPTGSA